jgi:hypothetical protein
VFLGGLLLQASFAARMPPRGEGAGRSSRFRFSSDPAVRAVSAAALASGRKQQELRADEASVSRQQERGAGDF